MTRTAPDIEAEIVAARAAGWTIAAISERTGRSPATIKRICSRHKVKPGEDQETLVAAARKELVSALTDDERIRALYGSLIVDTLAHVSIGRDKAAEAIALLTPTDTKSAALTLRGIAAHATATKAHADTLRALLPQPKADQDSLPALQVLTMTAEEIAAIREEQRREDAILNGDDLEDEQENDGGDVVDE